MRGGTVRPGAVFTICLSLLLAPGLLLPASEDTVSDPALRDLLAGTGRSVESFWQKLSSVTCTESVRQQKLGKNGKIEFKHDSTFDYLVITRQKGNELSLEESRLLKKDVDKSKERPLLTTTGFSTLLLIFHPRYRDCYRYYLDGDDMVGGKRLIRVRFQHIPGTRSTSALDLGGRVYPLDMEGAAWIDPDTNAIMKVSAELVAPMENLNLKAFYTVVEYRPQRFASSPEILWLPSTAAIDIETALQHWRNVHRFTEYKKFSIQEKVTSR